MTANIICHSLNHGVLILIINFILSQWCVGIDHLFYLLPQFTFQAVWTKCLLYPISVSTCHGFRVTVAFLVTDNDHYYNTDDDYNYCYTLYACACAILSW